MSESTDWGLYRSFLAVLAGGSLSSAGRVLGTSAATVGRHIATLEGALGVSLFTRSPEGLAATSEALALAPHAKAMAAAADALVRAAGGRAGDVTGTVRITAGEIVGAEWLPGLLCGLQGRYPGLAIELVLNNQIEDLLRRDADVAVRMTEPTQESLLARRVGQIEIGLFAHRKYLQARGAPETVAALADHILIGYDRELIAQRLAAGAGLSITRDQFALRSDSDLAQLALLRAGCGIGGCQVPIAARNPELVRVLGAEIRFEVPAWLVMHSDQRQVPRIRHTFDFLAEGLAALLPAARSAHSERALRARRTTRRPG